LREKRLNITWDIKVRQRAVPTLVYLFELKIFSSFASRDRQNSQKYLQTILAYQP
jgi:hypothetical protein